MSRLTFRPRPIDVFRKLEIFRSTKGLQLDDDVHIARDLPQSTSGTEADEDRQEAHVTAALQAVKKQAAIDIPIPKVVPVADYGAHKRKVFERPQSYIHFKDPPVDQDDVEYEMDEDDNQFLIALNAEKVLLNENKFESIIDQLEKESGKFGEVLPLAFLEGKIDCKQSVLTQVYNHWVKKRKAWGNALIRRFQHPPSVSDPSPNVTFRPREIQKAHRYKTRKNDTDGYQRLQQVRKDFERSRTLFSMITRREKMKKDVLSCLFRVQAAELKEMVDLRSNQEGTQLSTGHINPVVAAYDSLRSDDDQWQALQPQVATSLPLRAASGAKLRRGVAFDPVFEDDYDSYCSCSSAFASDSSSSDTDEDDDDSGDESIKYRQSHHIPPSSSTVHRPLPEPFTLPITADAKCIRSGAITGTSTSTSSNTPKSPTRPFTGRGRIGRGGRVIFERFTEPHRAPWTPTEPPPPPPPIHKTVSSTAAPAPSTSTSAAAPTQSSSSAALSRHHATSRTAAPASATNGIPSSTNAPSRSAAPATSTSASTATPQPPATAAAAAAAAAAAPRASGASLKHKRTEKSIENGGAAARSVKRVRVHADCETVR